jgi:putative DNA primase/helicase
MDIEISTQNDNLDAALELTASGTPVFPVHSIRNGRCTCGNPKCPTPGKHPRTRNGFKDATTDPEIIRSWNWGHSKIGMPTGEVTRVMILDVDPRHGGDRTLADLEAKYGPILRTRCVETAGGSRHYYFQYDPAVKNKANVATGLDTRSDGGYAIIPPTTGYKVIEDTDPAPYPEWLKCLKSGGTVLRNSGINTAEVRGGTEEGSRNDSIFRAVSSYRARNRSLEDALDLAKEAARNSKPPYPEDEAGDMVYRVYERYPPGDYPEPTTTIKDMAARGFAPTDMGNADKFEYLHGDDYRYVPAWHKFVVWDGRRWVLVERGIMGKWAEDTVKAMYAEAGQLDDKTDRIKLAAHAKSSESVSKRRAMVDTLKNRRTAVPQDFDTNPWLFNCGNGTLDLKTGELREHRRGT